MDNEEYKVTFGNENDNNNDNDSNENELTSEHVQQMFYIYNSVMNGWTVKKIGIRTFEFRKSRQDEMKDIYKRYFSRMARTVPPPQLHRRYRSKSKSQSQSKSQTQHVPSSAKVNFLDDFLAREFNPGK